MPNREQRRAAQRARRAAKQGGTAQKRTSAAQTGGPSFLRYRPFAAVGNYPQSEGLATSEFANLDELMAIIEVALRAAHDPNPDHWFPNNIAAHALLVRAYQGLQAAANLCALGFYVEATGLVRTVYESAGLARSLAHSLERAEEWVFAESWVRDKFSRDFARAMSSPEFTKEVNDWAGIDGDAFAHDQFYDFVSKYAHPLAKSTLQFLFNPKDENEPALYPAVEEKWFNDCALLITATAVVVAYALRNAASDFTALPAEWHQRLAAVTRNVTALPLSHLDRDWEAHQARHEAVVKEMRHSDELDEALNADPTSRRNAIGRLADPLRDG
jgi:hypothetical protein